MGGIKYSGPGVPEMTVPTALATAVYVGYGATGGRVVVNTTGVLGLGVMKEACAVGQGPEIAGPTEYTDAEIGTGGADAGQYLKATTGGKLIVATDGSIAVARAHEDIAADTRGTVRVIEAMEITNVSLLHAGS